MLKAREEKPGAGILLIFLAFFLFTGIDTSAKWLTQAGMAVTMVVFIRYAVHLAITLGVAFSEGEFSVWRMNRPLLTLIRGSMLVIGTFSNFTALQYLPLTVTVTIFFTVPLVATGMAALFLGERVGLRRWSAILVGFTGVLVVTQPWGAGFHWAMLLSLVAVTVTAVYILLTRALAGEESPDTMQFWAAFLPVLALGPVAAFNWSLPGAPIEWFFFFLIGTVGWAGHQAWTLAYRYAEASMLAPFQYIQIIFMALSSWLIFHEPPARETLIGAAIVIASGLYVWTREQALSRA